MAGVGERQNLILQKYMDFYPDLPIFLLNKYISVTFCMFDIFDICDIFVSVKSGSRLPHKVLKKKNTARLYGDALVWSAVFIDWLDWFELVS